MSTLPDESKTKRGRNENEDRLGDLPDCILLHVLSFLNAKQAVQTCILSTRWKHLWKRNPALILNSLDFSNLKSFDRFVYRVMSLHDTSIALSTFGFDCHGNTEPRFLRKIAKYIASRSAQLQRLEISVRGDSSFILPCISSCRALTHLKLSVEPKDRYFRRETLFPKSLNLPALTTLDLTSFSFCTSDDDADCAEPFSLFNSLNSLTILSCTVKDAQILRISSATLVNLTMNHNCSDFSEIELFAPSLSSFTIVGTPDQRLCGSTLSSVKQVNIDVTTYPDFGEHPLVLLSWLLDLPNIKSLTVTSSTFLVLSKVSDLFQVDFPSLCNLKSLKVKTKPLLFGESGYLEAVMLENTSRKEASKMKKVFKEELEPAATIQDRIVDFLLQNSPSAEVDVITN